MTLSSGHHLFCCSAVSKMLFFSGWFQDCLWVLVLEQLDYDLFKCCVCVCVFNCLWICWSTNHIGLRYTVPQHTILHCMFTIPSWISFHHHLYPLYQVVLFLIYLVQCSLNLMDLLNLSLSKFGEISSIIFPDSSCRYIKPFDIIPQVLEALFISPPQIFLCFSDWILSVDLYWNSLSFLNCTLFRGFFFSSEIIFHFRISILIFLKLLLF